MNCFCFTTQRYDVTYVRFRKHVLLNLVEELNGTHGPKWNAKRVTIFQTVILQHFQLINGAKTFVCKLMLDLTRGTAEILMDSYMISMPQIRDTWGGLSGIKVLSSVTVHH